MANLHSRLPRHRTILAVDIEPVPARVSAQADLAGLIDRSSFGTEGGVSLRRRTSPGVADALLARLRQHERTVSPAGKGKYQRERDRLRGVMYELVDRSLVASGITLAYRDGFLDRGDGLLALIHPVDEVPKTVLLSQFIPHLTEQLGAHNAGCAASGLRMRAVLHAGEVHFDDRGCFGESLDVALRLLDAPEVTGIFRRTTDSLLCVVSDNIYRTVVRHGYDGIDQRGFVPVAQVRVAGREHNGWVWLSAEESAHLTGPPESSVPPVIVVHHNPTWRELITRRLTERGFPVLAGTEDVFAANRLARSARPDAELVDLISTDEVPRIIGDVRDARILIVSEEGDRSAAVRTVSAGATQVIADLNAW